MPSKKCRDRSIVAAKMSALASAVLSLTHSKHQSKLSLDKAVGVTNLMAALLLCASLLPEKNSKIARYLEAVFFILAAATNATDCYQEYSNPAATKDDSFKILVLAGYAVLATTCAVTSGKIFLTRTPTVEEGRSFACVAPLGVCLLGGVVLTGSENIYQGHFRSSSFIASGLNILVALLLISTFDCCKSNEMHDPLLSKDILQRHGNRVAFQSDDASMRGARMTSSDSLSSFHTARSASSNLLSEVDQVKGYGDGVASDQPEESWLGAVSSCVMM